MSKTMLSVIALVALLAGAGLMLFEQPAPEGGITPFLKGEMAQLTIPEAPQTLSDHIIMSENGDPKKLSQMAGKAMLINLWAPWCAPCRAEMKELANLQKELGDDAFEVVAINVDRGGIPQARETLEEWGVEGLPLYAEPTMKIAFDLAEGALPTSFVVDKAGNVQALFLGPLAWDKPEALELFEALKNGDI
ncbi:TlpA disulfide reductase family protein [Kordiimonas aquimaris]|uniref:TlpA disulfide reductase family protein n=1 Tax=Kordiimonas aquimaris TaxID=707591 RepID=UPI0021D32850|nr:TlpA disulfide reductase family protein [Kordiimonas aquimaris]